MPLALQPMLMFHLRVLSRTFSSLVRCAADLMAHRYIPLGDPIPLVAIRHRNCRQREKHRPWLGPLMQRPLNGLHRLEAEAPVERLSAPTTTPRQPISVAVRRAQAPTGCSIQINAVDFWSRYGWHKDSVERHDPSGSDWQASPYPVSVCSCFCGDQLLVTARSPPKSVPTQRPLSATVSRSPPLRPAAGLRHERPPESPAATGSNQGHAVLWNR